MGGDSREAVRAQLRAGGAGVVGLGVLFALGLAGCTGTSESPDPVFTDDNLATAIFEIPRGEVTRSGFYTLPFPNDLRTTADGRVDLDGYPAPNALIGVYVEAISADQHGFGRTSPIHFRFDAAIDPRSLPATPLDSTREDAAVYLIDVDPSSPEVGRRIPVTTYFQAHAGDAIGTNSLAILPYRGIVLRARTRYAAVITDRLRAADGRRFGRDEDFAALLRGDRADQGLRRAQEIYQPLLAWLAEHGDPGELVSATVFTTGAPTDMLWDVRRVVWERAAPTSGEQELTLHRISAYSVTYTGTVGITNFQSGEIPYQHSGGEIVRDTEGNPVAQWIESVRFSLTLPLSEVPSRGFPISLYAHGTGGNFLSCVANGIAEELAKQGVATISLDQVLHGARANVSDVLAFFNFQNPLAARHTPVQGAADLLQLVRFVIEFDRVEPKLQGRRLRFDSDKIMFFGHSQGGITGTLFLANSTEVKGGVLSGAGGLLYLGMLLREDPPELTAWLPILIRDQPLNRYNPVLALIQMFMEPADPASYASQLVRAPRPECEPKNVLVTEGIGDHVTPNEATRALSLAIGTDVLEPVQQDLDEIEWIDRTRLEAPASSNRGVTAVTAQYQPSSSYDGHFVTFLNSDARRQTAAFLGTLANTGVATVVE